MTKFPFDPLVRGSHFKWYSEYNKLRKHKKRQFKQKVLDSLDELRGDNPKEYRKLINSLKEEEKEGPESTIELDKWYAYMYFRSLNKIPEKYKTKIEEINKIVKNMENSPTFCELDYKITSSEIMKAISKLKSGKAVGLDSLPNEILKSGGSGGTILVPILQKLFNLVFTSGIYPSKGSSAYLCPKFKSSDPSKPENYRGIAIDIQSIVYFKKEKHG